MNYELVKKLKDAGYIQWTFDTMRPLRGYYIWQDDPHRVHVMTDDDVREKTLVHSMYVPTLSELIEACDVDWIRVEKGANILFRGKESPLECRAQAQGKKWEDKVIEEYGETLEEAVAKLWLTLAPQKIKKEPNPMNLFNSSGAR